MYNELKHNVCSRCLMDTTASDIKFDQNNHCNYCTDFLNKYKKENYKKELNFDQLIETIKKEGKNKKYDCIVGVSGGVDSSFVLYKVVEFGLRPLAVHLDNGWNSELAQNNISNLVKKLNVDLYTKIVDWEEYRNLQEAFFASNVIDIELLLDNAMLAINYQMAEKYNIKYILSGTNTSTEGFKIPNNWSWFKNDKKNIYSIAKKFKNIKPKTMPTFGTFNFIYYEILKKIKWVLFLDYLNYIKKDAIAVLEKNCGFKKYPYKHYESVFTRFYQGYILPKKFNVDKRKLHLSNLICTEQMSRDEAISLLQQPCYLNEEDEIKDKKFFLKKMEWSEEKLENYIKQEEISHDKYGSEKKFWTLLKDIYQKYNLKFFLN